MSRDCRFSSLNGYILCYTVNKFPKGTIIRITIKYWVKLMKIGLVDDQKYDLEKLSAIVGAHDDAEIVFGTTHPEEALKRMKKKEIELLFTDIEMPGLSGYELADLIDSYALEIAVVFVTAHSGYAVHAYELNVVDYILKPYRKERVAKALERYKQRKRQYDELCRLVIKKQTEIHFINMNEIIFIERTGRTTTIVSAKEVYETYQTLNELEEQLPNKTFIRASRGSIVNIHFIKHFRLYTKNTYIVSFFQTPRNTYISKKMIDEFQKRFF